MLCSVRLLWLTVQLIIFQGSEKECDWSKDCVHAAIHQTGGSHHHRISSTGICVWQRHPGTHHLWLWWPWDDGNGRCFSWLLLLLCSRCSCHPCYCHVISDVTAFPGEAISGWSFCNSRTECGVELYWFQRSETRCDKGTKNQICQRGSAERDAATRGSQRFLRDQEGLFLRVSPAWEAAAQEAPALTACSCLLGTWSTGCCWLLLAGESWTTEIITATRGWIWQGPCWHSCSEGTGYRG